MSLSKEITTTGIVRKEIELTGGGPPWGFRLSTSHTTNYFKVARVNPESEASLKGMRDGDLLLQVNGQATDKLSLSQVQKVLRGTGDSKVSIVLGSRSSTSSNNTGGSGSNTGLNNVVNVKSSLDEDDDEGTTRVKVISVQKKKKKLPQQQQQSETGQLNSTNTKEAINNTNGSNFNHTTKDKTAKDNNSSSATLLGEIIAELEVDWDLFSNNNNDESATVGERPCWTKDQQEGEIPPLLKEGEEEQVVIWTPKDSPTVKRKFKPVKFNVVEGPKQNDQLTLDISQTHQSQSPPPLQQSQQSQPHLPRYQSPTVTLLQKAREGQLPKGAHYLENNNEAGAKNTVQPSPSTPSRVNKIIERPSSTPITSTSTSALSANSSYKVVESKQLSSKIPTTPEGVPTISKSVLSEEEQKEWYRRMYDNLHVEKVQQLQQLKGPPAKRFWSENSSEATTPTSNISNIRFTPGKIEDYNPESSTKKVVRTIPKDLTKHWALSSPTSKGYESDSNYIIKRDRSNIISPPPPPPLSPAEQRQLYVEIQKGGEVPFKGLGKRLDLLYDREVTKANIQQLLRSSSRSTPTLNYFTTSTTAKIANMDHHHRPTTPTSTSSYSLTRTSSRPTTPTASSTRVHLLQSVLNNKLLSRSKSDLNNRGQITAKFIQNVRRSHSVSQLKSNIPIRVGSRPFSTSKSSENIMKHSSPELVSPREVRKATQSICQHHKVSVKVETPSKKETISVSVASGKSTNNNGTKKGVKKVNNGGANVQQQVKKKSVKILNGESSGVPVKPPRQKMQRHSSCLSTDSSRTASPGPSISSGKSITTTTGSKTPGKTATRQVSPPVGTKGTTKTSTPVTTSTLTSTAKQTSRSPTPTKTTTVLSKEQQKQVQKSSQKGKQKMAQVTPTKTSLLREQHNIIQQPHLLRRTLSTNSLPTQNYQNYIKILKTRSNSPHFKTLHNLYSSLDRLTKLNQSTQYYDVTTLPRSKTYDFDAWFKVRNRLRIDKEMEELSNKLIKAQLNREFFFMPMNNRLRYETHLDPGIRVKKFSVQELKEILNSTKEIERSAKDLYKLNYRGITVKESALNLEVNELYKKEVVFDREFYRPILRRAFSMSSTLSQEQRNCIKERISSFINRKQLIENGEIKEITKDASVKRIVTRPMGFTLSSDRYVQVRPSSAMDLSESFKKEMSAKLSEELKLKKDQLLLKNVDKNYRSLSPDVKIRPSSPEKQDKMRILTKLANLLLKSENNLNKINTGKVERLTDYFESQRSLNKCIYCSDSNLDRKYIFEETKRCASSAEIIPEKYLETRSRKPIYQPSSSPNVCQATLMAPYASYEELDTIYNEPPKEVPRRILDDRFKNYDASLHQPKYRYVPPPQYTSLPIQHYQRTVLETGWNSGGRLTQQATSPVSPSPNYIKSTVNIHYKAPVVLQEKQYINEDELRLKQEIAMKKFYEDQRKAKYLKEIEDMERRRHSDYFVPSQKSPIPLNRYDYDDENNEDNYYDIYGLKKARVLFDFVAQSGRELNLSKGSTVVITKKLDANWYEGLDSSGVSGIFPCSYVQPITKQASSNNKPSQLQQATALYNFNPSSKSSKELPLIKGEKVQITRQIDSNWFEGKIGERIGIFPINYVKVNQQPVNNVHSFEPNSFSMESDYGEINSRQIGVDVADCRKSGLRYRSLYNYTPAHEDELEVREDDIIQVMEKCDDGWFVGLNERTRLFGTFPGNYVVKI